VSPRVSIIIPHYERFNLLAEAVKSILRSSEQDFEVIVVDDGSSDDEFHTVQSLQSPRLRVLQRDLEVSGPSRCRNIGIEASVAELVIFLDSDDIMAPWCLKERLDASARHPDADCWVFPVLLFETTPGDKNILWNAMQTETEDAIRFIRSDTPWHTSSTLWRKSALENLSGFDERLSYGEDSDLHLRALLSGIDVQRFADALPDIFVRRSAAPRITNSPAAQMVPARRRRLTVGTDFLNSAPQFAAYLRMWEGQYFMEAEFLLFNVDGSSESIAGIIEDWEAAFSPSRTLRSLVRLYFKIAIACRRNAYLLLRIARRAAMKSMPSSYFPVSGAFHTAVASPALMEEVIQRLNEEGGAMSEKLSSR
jgi:glycosyltransferase involved in cell wall biosynthesis